MKLCHFRFKCIIEKWLSLNEINNETTINIKKNKFKPLASKFNEIYTYVKFEIILLAKAKQ